MPVWLLLGGGILAALAFSGGSRAPVATTAPPPPPPQSSSVLSPANILAAYQYALGHETSVANLTSFGNALVAYGYPSQGASLLAKAATLSKASAAPVAVAPTGVTSSTFTPEQAGMKALDPTQTAAAGEAQELCFWLNHYIGTDYKTGCTPSASDVQKAAAYAIAHETLAANLSEFATELNAYGYNSEYVAVTAALTKLLTKALSPYVKHYAGTSTVSANSLHAAVTQALKDTSVSEMQAFAALLVPYENFGVAWGGYGAEILQAAAQAQTKALLKGVR
jgi:hypothetical protein